ncbi:MAG: amino acid permease [Halobacteriaceae archaeon]
MSDEELAKDLGPLAALTIGVGTMIGAGIFILPGVVVEDIGPLAAVAFTLGGAIALFTALSASELGTAMPRSGGAYYYVNHALGPLFGSVAGWANWIGLAFASAFYMFGFGTYIARLTGVDPTAPVVLAGLGLTVATGLTTAKGIALLGAVFFTVVNYVGAKETGRLQNIIVITLVGILAVFTAYGVLNFELTRLRPLAPDGRADYVQLLPVTGLVFVSYLGFVQITSVAEEIKDPGRNLPRAVIGSVLLVTVVYSLVLLVVLGAVDNSVVAGRDTAMVDAARLIIGPIGAAALLFGGLLATASSANASILASSRINFAMGRDGLVSSALNDIHDRFGTPYRSIAITGGLILVFIIGADLELLASVGSALHLIIYGLLNIALIVMRTADPEEYQPAFRVPGYPAVPVIGAVTSFALIIFIVDTAILLSLGLAIGGVLWYLVYARRRATKQGILGQYILSRRESLPDPAISAAQTIQPDGGEYRVMIPVADPAHETDLVTLGAAMAEARGGVIDLVHIVQIPDQTSLEYGAENLEEFDTTSDELLRKAREDAAPFDVTIESRTIVSHRSFEEVFDAAADHGADLLVMGWGPSHGAPGRAESGLDELVGKLPCDVLALRDRGFDASEILVPTAGGPDSELSAAVATGLQEEFEASVTLLHAVAPGQRTAGETFLREWAEEHGLGGATRRVVETDDVEAAIEDAASDASLLVLGATERGLVGRLLTGSLVMDVVENTTCSVILAERQGSRSLLDRLF